MNRDDDDLFSLRDLDPLIACVFIVAMLVALAMLVVAIWMLIGGLG